MISKKFFLELYEKKKKKKLKKKKKRKANFINQFIIKYNKIKIIKVIKLKNKNVKSTATRTCINWASTPKGKALDSQK